MNSPFESIEPTLNDERLDRIVEELCNLGVRRILDLGCGPGDLLTRLIPVQQFEKIIGIDISFEALAIAREVLGHAHDEKRVSVQRLSFAEPNDLLVDFDAAVLVETIEHINPEDLSAVERAVFKHFRPCHVIITTPNQEYNSIYGLRPGQFRHPDHRFEWTRTKFEKWASGVGERNHYSVEFDGIGEFDFQLGHPTQMAIFSRVPGPVS